MVMKHLAEVPGAAITAEGFQGMTAHFALTRADGCPRYAMRVMEFQPGGHTSLHAHEEEHEFFFWEGEAICRDGQGGETKLVPGDLLYTAPREPHQLLNVGPGVMRVICTIPLLANGDGKTTTPVPVSRATCTKPGSAGTRES
ncbi:MAG: cupin domain-containing protein [Deltaproteobacteria bacterium]|nr:cupin domain-containing protein [Deltaproteobacteria bacterium]